MQECGTDCSQITSCMPGPFVWDSCPPSMARSKSLPPQMYPSCTHVSFTAEDGKQRLSLGNTDFQIFKRKSSELAVNGDLMVI